MNSVGSELLTNPSTGEEIGAWRDSTPDELDVAVRTAIRASDELGALSRFERCELLESTSGCLEARREHAVLDLMLEHGKVRLEAEAECDAAIHGLKLHAEHGRFLDGSLRGVADPRKRVITDRIAIGLVGVITPWNFPLNIPIEYIGPALAMGNAVVWKGAETTPRSTQHLLNSFREAGWPRGSVSCVEGGPATGEALVRRRELAAICFTGSSAVGRGSAAVGGMRRLILELGGNGPTVVFGDADIERAAAGAARAATFCSGQSCAATERVLVEGGVYEAFLEAVVSASAEMKVGSSDDPAAHFGPLHLQQTADTVARHVQDAARSGARILTGGAPEEGYASERYWPLTVLADLEGAPAVLVEETFGPVLPVVAFDDVHELRQLLDSSQYGLSAAVYTSDLQRAFEIAESIRCGSVIVNDHSNTWETHIPFGGYPGSDSGIGRVGCPDAMIELSTTKTIVFDIGA